MNGVRTLAVGSVFVLAACQTTISAEERGLELLRDRDLSDSFANSFACSTCHEVDPDQRGREIYAGYSLLDAAYRESYWGGYMPTLLDAMSFCRRAFMRGLDFDPENEDARAILEYLLSVSEPAPQPELPLTITLNITDLPPGGDPVRGETVYVAACQRCHGRVGALPPNRTLDVITPIPGDAEGWSALYDEIFPRAPPDGSDPIPYARIVTEKVRHGRFFGVTGVMPPFSLEALSDEDLRALLAHLGL